MKKYNQGSILITVVLIVLALIVGIVGTYSYLDKGKSDTTVEINTPEPLVKDVPKQEVSQTAPVPLVHDEDVVVPTPVNTVKNPAVTSYALTDNEILGATFRITPYFPGTVSSAHDIVFPASLAGSHDASGKVDITKEGIVTLNPTSPKGELFMINGYKYSDSSRTEAKVFITGNFGASGFDDHIFIVSKVNGVVTTKEVACKKTANGSCPMDLN